MKKKTYAILSGITLLSLGAALALSHTEKIESLLFRNEPRKQLNTFIIDEDTTFTSQGDYYQGVAISEGQVEINTKFMGFEKEGDKLVADANSPISFTNTTPMNVGFDSFHCEFSGEGTFKYSIMVFFSYFELNLDDIVDGQYADLQRFGRVHVEATNSINETVAISDVPGMIDCKYILGVIIAESDLTLEEMEFGTPCTDQVPVVSEKGTFTDYTASEKALLTGEKFGELIPFLGHGGYYMHAVEDEIFIEGMLVDDELGEPFLGGLVNQGYQPTKGEDPSGENEYGNYWFQKQDGTTVYTFELEFCMNALFTIKIRLTLNEDIAGLYTSWPEDLFRDVLSEEFADFAIDNPPDLDDDVYYYAVSENDGEEVYLALVVSGYDTDYEAISDIVAYLNDLLANYPEYYTIDDSDEIPSSASELYEDFEFSISDGIHTIGVFYEEGEGVYLLFAEEVMRVDFPTELINSYLGLEQGVNFPSFTETGEARFNYDPDDAENGGKFDIDIYFSSREELEAYCQALENFGLNRIGTYSTSYTYTSSIFDSYSLYVGFYNLDSNNKIDIEFSKSGSGNYSNCSTFNDAKNAAANNINYFPELVREHDYPELVGDHIYRYCNSESSYQGLGIYISDLGQDYLDSVIDGATYSDYYGAYVFEDEVAHNEYGNDYMFAIDVQIISGGVRINPRTVEVVPQSELVDSVTANQRILAAINSNYGYLEQSDPTKYAAIMEGVVSVPDSHGDKVYSALSDSYPEFAIYGENRQAYAEAFGLALQNNDYTYSKILNRYYHSNNVVSVWKNSNYNTLSSSEGIFFQFNIDYATPYIDFVSYADANISGFESAYANFPHEGSEKIFYRLTGTNKIAVSDDFDLDQYFENVENNGFTRFYYGDSETRFEKQYGNSLLEIRVTDSYKEGVDGVDFNRNLGYHLIELIEQENYFESYADMLENPSADEVPAAYLNLLPAYASADALFHLRYASSSSMEILFKSTLDVDGFIDAAINSGYTRTKQYRLYAFDGVNYVQMEIEKDAHLIRLYFRSYEWTTLPSYTDKIDSLFYFMHDYILLPEESGNIFYADEYSGGPSSFDFYLKKTVDIEAYVELLEDFGYEAYRVTSSRVEMTYEVNENVTIECNIRRENAYYRVYYYCYSSFDKTVNMADLSAFITAKGYSAMNILPSSASLVFTYFSINTYSAPYQFNLEGNLTDTCAETFVDLLLENGYTKLESLDTYTKSDANYQYSIEVSGSYIRINVLNIN